MKKANDKPGRMVTRTIDQIENRRISQTERDRLKRLAAQPGSRDYGYLTVTTQITSKVEYLFTVAPGSFAPPPKVESAVVRLTPESKPLPDLQGFLKFASAAFRQKRKNLRNNLSVLFDKNRIQSQPEATLRAEQLSIPQLIDLHRRLTL